MALVIYQAKRQSFIVFSFSSFAASLIVSHHCFSIFGFWAIGQIKKSNMKMASWALENSGHFINEAIN